MWTFKLFLNLVLLLRHHTGLMGWIYLSPYVALRYIKCPPLFFYLFTLLAAQNSILAPLQSPYFPSCVFLH